MEVLRSRSSQLNFDYSLFFRQMGCSRPNPLLLRLRSQRFELTDPKIQASLLSKPNFFGIKLTPKGFSSSSGSPDIVLIENQEFTGGKE